MVTEIRGALENGEIPGNPRVSGSGDGERD